MDKETLRKAVIKERLELTNQEILTRSRIICQKIINTPEYKSAKVVYMYYAVNNEVSLRMIYDDCRKNNKIMAFPKVVGDKIKFCVAESEDDFEIGKFSIPEPKSNEEAPAPDIILVPGVAFSQDCMRIGYGGGFYDKFLSEVSVHSVGICYSFQVLESIPTTSHDERLDEIVFLLQFENPYNL